jgi:hypothetical protein
LTDVLLKWDSKLSLIPPLMLVLAFAGPDLLTKVIPNFLTLGTA